MAENSSPMDLKDVDRLAAFKSDLEAKLTLVEGLSDRERLLEVPRLT